MKNALIVLLLATLWSCSLTPSKKAFRKTASDKNWGFLVLSDIHVYTKAKEGRPIVPKDFSVLVEQLKTYTEEKNIKFIVLLGDSTGGNEKDGRSLHSVKMWWDELYKALVPLMDKGVKILPVAGNHDYYTDNHQLGYKYAWCKFVGEAPHCQETQDNSELKLSAPNRLWYMVSYGAVDLFLLHAVKYNLGKEQEEWLSKAGTESKDNGSIKFAMGHVALRSRLVDKPVGLGDKLMNLMEALNIKHYIAGHEHYFWDEFMGRNKFRQTIMGTSSGTYNFKPTAKNLTKSCKKNICEMGPDGNKFYIREKDKKQVYGQMFLHFAINESDINYKLNPMALHKGRIVPFVMQD